MKKKIEYNITEREFYHPNCHNILKRLHCANCDEYHENIISTFENKEDAIKKCKEYETTILYDPYLSKWVATEYVVEEYEYIIDDDNDIEFSTYNGIWEMSVLSQSCFVKQAIENHTLQNDSTHVWCTVDELKVIAQHNIKEEDPFEVSIMLENNPEHELWDALYESYKEGK